MTTPESFAVQHAHLTLSTQALRHNLNIIQRTAPHSRILAMVKADGYGHGAVAVARLLCEPPSPVDALGVAHTDEAVLLDAAGITTPIVLLEGVRESQELTLASQKNWPVVIHQRAQLEMLMNTALPSPIYVWVKIETGMHRLGFMQADFPAVQVAIHDAVRQGKIYPDPVLLSHFASADDVNSDQTGQQILRFDKAYAGWHGRGSLANSAGIFAWPQSHRDWVRPGIGLYGVSPFADRVGADLGLKPVMRLTAPVLALKTVPAGESVGYGATWRATRQTSIAVIGIGYGDGYPRHIYPHSPSHSPVNSCVLLHGIQCPIIGRVSMDMMMIDCSAVPRVQIGDSVLLWGEGLPVEHVAYTAGTSGYELLTQITKRVTRTWI